MIAFSSEIEGGGAFSGHKDDANASNEGISVTEQIQVKEEQRDRDRDRDRDGCDRLRRDYRKRVDDSSTGLLMRLGEIMANFTLFIPSQPFPPFSSQFHPLIMYNFTLKALQILDSANGLSGRRSWQEGRGSYVSMAVLGFDDRDTSKKVAAF
ncbi:hypothetical protein CDL15_Pgr019802 [Punica granatum]|uniref:Uncharacterized protein n=1 Tax=Punica granatum TaxID=22663 RepID=A0A218X831_PUNGR|nr:hypothetical protein CDL15_Pgr019802 [Punica granatum]